ncbi:MAG TPA: hypothetical protein VMC43_01700 [Candidatus Paceibacterota bacterium]|nr:hypothetical protein [Candidatus Paceibacterota bacterium]
MNRVAKQLIYGSIYIGILVLFGFGVYQLFLKPAPTCFDRIQNQGELGIDCGPVCGNICLPPDLKPIVATSLQIFYPAPGQAVILAKVQNANPTLAVRSFDYSFDVLGDNDSSTVNSFKGSSFLYAGEIKYLAEFVSDSELPRGSRLKFRVLNPDWVTPETFRKPELSFQDRRTDVSSSSIQVSGQLLQKDTITLPTITVLAVFHGQDVLGPIIGVSKTELDDVAPGENRPFAIVYPALQTIDPAKTEIIAYAERP